MVTMYLTSSWDLSTDGSHNIASVSGSYSVIQNVATAIRVFLGEEYFQGSNGIPYFNIFTNNLPLSYLTSQIEKTALKVQYVTAARAVINKLQNRKLEGTLIITDSISGGENVIKF